MYLILRIVQNIIFIYFAISTLHVLILSVAGRFFQRLPISIPDSEPARIAVLIPCYKEDLIIINSIKSYALQDYPKDKFKIYLVADSLQKTTLKLLKTFDINVIEADFDVSTVTKSIKLGVTSIDHREFPMTLICDADNILAHDFLKKINAVFSAGYQAVQGCRYTKNINTPMAILDSVSEMINNHLYRKGTYSLGLSSALIGSGMAFKTSLLQDCMQNNNAIHGWDRELQLLLSEREITIAYLENAICYDEKVSSQKAFKNQRKRWLDSQFTTLTEHFAEAFMNLGKKGGLNYFQFAILFNLFLTRLLNIGILGTITIIDAVIYFFFRPEIFLPPYYWLALFTVYGISLILAIPTAFMNGKLVSALLKVPGTFLGMFILLFKTKEARTKFDHTEHTINEVETSMHKPGK